MRALSAALAADAIPGGGLVAAALFTAATAVFIAAAFAFGLLPKCAGGVQPARRSSQWRQEQWGWGKRRCCQTVLSYGRDQLPQSPVACW